MYDLKLFGGLFLEAAAGSGNPLGARRHPLALLALLATARESTLGRGALVGLLWPGSPEAAARNRLSTCVHKVRSVLGRDVLRSRGDALRLDRDAFRCDVWRFEEALEADPARAVRVWGGRFLGDFRLPGSAAFEQWADREDRRFRRAYREALEVLAVDAESSGRYGDAADLRERQWEEDPYDARIVMKLMRSLAAAGRHARALQMAERHHTLLRDDLDLEPHPEVSDLARRLRADAGGSPAGEPPDRADDAATAGPTQSRSLQAFRLQVVARSMMNQRTRSGLEEATACFTRAIDHDPAYARAWAGLGSAIMLRWSYGHLEAAEAVPEAERAARGALRLEPGLAEANLVLGLIHDQRRDGPAAIRALRAAVESDPTFPDAWSVLAWEYLLTGRAEEARGAAERGVRVNPLSAEAAVNLLFSSLSLGDPETALREAATLRTMAPDYRSGTFLKALTLYELGRFDEAIEILGTLDVPWAEPGATATLALAHAAAGEEERARPALARFLETGEAFAAGLIHLALGEEDRGLELLARADMDAYWPVLSVHHLYRRLWDPLRGDPRMDSLARRAHVAWGLAPDGSFPPDDRTGQTRP